MSTMLQGDPLRLKAKSECIYFVVNKREREGVVYVALIVLTLETCLQTLRGD